MGRILPRPSSTGPAWAACTARVAYYYSRAAARAHGWLMAQRARWPKRIARALTRARRRGGVASWGGGAGPTNNTRGEGSIARRVVLSIGGAARRGTHRQHEPGKPARRGDKGGRRQRRAAADRDLRG
jgi:hypothetical protein